MVQDRSAVEDDYQLVSAADIVLNEPRDLKDLVVAQRAEKEESDSEDQENAREPLDRGTRALPARYQAPAQAPEQRPAKQVRKKAKASLISTPPYSPPHPVPLDPLAQPQHVQPESDHMMDEGPSTSAAPAVRQRSPQAAANIRDLPNGNSHTKAHRTPQVVSRPQVDVLDAQSRETRMCAWCPTDAVLASG